MVNNIITKHTRARNVLLKALAQGDKAIEHILLNQTKLKTTYNASIDAAVEKSLAEIAKHQKVVDDLKGFKL